MSSVNRAEIEKFEKMADHWWDQNGEFAPLHAYTPVRLDFIKTHLRAHFDVDFMRPRPLDGLSILDIGCGGGLLCEPLAALGARVTGIDASARNIAVAQAHAQNSGYAITYKAVTAEALHTQGKKFDVITCMEVIEHVDDPAAFVATAGGLAGKNGVMFFTTVNRTAKAFVTTIIGAEYLLRVLPRGTHDYRKFIKPSELQTFLAAAGFDLADLAGATYHPLAREFRHSEAVDVNYMACAVRSS